MNNQSNIGHPTGEVTSVSDREKVNNAYYDQLGERWFSAEDDPVALLRAEGDFRAIWVESVLGSTPQDVLDIGCGAGFLSQRLAKQGHRVTGLDASAETLAVAQRFDATQKVNYVLGDAYRLPFPDQSFETVTAMDFLEHVSDPQKVIAEVKRVLKPGGRFFFHTFNRNWLSHLIVIKGVEWFVKNTPKDLHVIELFIKPQELTEWLNESDFEIREMRGLRPVFLQKAFWKMLATGRVSPDFRFAWTPSLTLGYTGLAQKSSEGHESH